MEFATVATMLAKQFGEQAIAQIQELKQRSDADRTAQNAVSTAVDPSTFNETGSKVSVQPAGQILSAQA